MGNRFKTMEAELQALQKRERKREARRRKNDKPKVQQRQAPPASPSTVQKMLEVQQRQAPPASPSTVQKMLQVLNDKHLLPLILVHGVRNEILAYVHRMLMVEAVNTTMGGIAQEMHDEVLEYILQEPQCLPVVSYLFGKGRHKEATERLVQQLMALNPDANRARMLSCGTERIEQGRNFDANALLKV